MKTLFSILFFIVSIMGHTQVATSNTCHSKDSVWVNMIKMKNLKSGQVFYYLNEYFKSDPNSYLIKNEATSYMKAAPVHFGHDSICWHVIDSLLKDERAPIYFTKNIYNPELRDTVVILNMCRLNVSIDDCYRCRFVQRAMFCDDEYSSSIFDACIHGTPNIEHCESCYYYLKKVNSW